MAQLNSFNLNYKELIGDHISVATERLTQLLINKCSINKDTVIVGIFENGVHIKNRIVYQLKKQKINEFLEGEIDTSLFMEIEKSKNYVNFNVSRIPDLSSKDVILIDDLIYTGNTCKAALNALSDYGHPKTVTIGVLFDLNQNNFPVVSHFSAFDFEKKVDKKPILSLVEVTGEDNIDWS